MKQLETITEAGIYLAKDSSSDTTFLVRVTGTSPFLSIDSMINFSDFIKGNDFSNLPLVFDPIGIEWYKFDYIVEPIEEAPKKQRKVSLKNPYNEKHFINWVKIYAKSNETECTRKILEETDLPLDYVQTELLPKIKRYIQEHALN